MKNKPLGALVLGLLIFSLYVANAQNGTIVGTVVDALSNEPIPFANIVLDSVRGTTSDLDGNFRIENLEPGTYNLQCSYIGYQTETASEIRLSSNRPTTVNFRLSPGQAELEEITLKASPFQKTPESPVSLRKISASEIYRNPGGNRDISKVLQSLPGVSTTVSFRNDIIIRGGAPNENRFFIDGIEVPNINHFATQGSSGGPVGLINVNFIESVDFYSGAFPANRGNALSAIIEFQQIQGNPERLAGNLMLGSSDIGLTLDGPIGQNSNFLFSLRRSYLQLLFKALALPFLPTYNDAQARFEHRFNSKNKIVFVGLGAIDDFELNQSVNDGVTDPQTLKRNEYILGNLPVNTQWNYAIGANYTHYAENSYQNVIFSRNHLNNASVKYRNNVEQPENLLLDYQSQEIENKLRVEQTTRWKGVKINAGGGIESATYTVNSYQANTRDQGPEFFIVESSLKLLKYSAFAQASQSFLNSRLRASLGLRTDFNNFSDSMNKPWKQLSPRASASYSLNEKWSLNANVGRYYQLPAYTVLGYRDSNGTLANTDVKYIQVDHYIAGVEWLPSPFSSISVEGFFKDYANYPLSLRNGVSLANLGGDFGVIGNEPVSSASEGQSYGIEFLAQQKLSNSIYGILSYTFVRSFFDNGDGEPKPSSWDNQHVLNITAGKKFKNNWELGLKFRFLGPGPYTPFDAQLTAQKEVWDNNQQGILDYSRVNSLRNPATHGLDIRLDKKWFFSKTALNAYIDIQNIYNFQTEAQAFLTVQRDAQGQAITDPNNPDAYLLERIPNTSGTLLPSIGLMWEF